jgi:hypothetical protein
VSKTGRSPHPKAGGRDLPAKLDKGGHDLSTAPGFSQKLLPCQTSVEKQHSNSGILTTMFIL